ncbi:MAG: zinc-binding dehydrogenase [Longimicrobiales bacterium]|nr:zinc-binding dehydrogenase [Longimicrobiales bacterium]
MRAVRFHYRPLRYVLTRLLSGRLPAMGAGRLGFVRLDDVPRRALPADDWVRLEPRLSGICGSDLGVITAHDSFTLEPYGAYPFTFGHEVVATVAETGAAVTRWSEGDRVILNPMLACEQKGEDPCAACRRGDPGVCRRATDGSGSIAGFSPLTGGGWADELVAHESMLRPQGDLPDEVAVLTDAYASAAKGVFLEPPRADDVVLVIGAGNIGLLMVRALRRIGWEGTIAVSARYGFQAEKAKALGADVVVRGRDQLYEWASSLPGADTFEPSLAPRFVEGGPSLVYDSVGSAGTVRDALALTREEGRIVVTGAAAVSKVDLTRLWHRQLRMTGVMVYGPVEWQGRSRDIFDATLDLIRGDDLGRFNLLTHTFELEEYRDAIRVALGKEDHGAIKVGVRVR